MLHKFTDHILNNWRASEASETLSGVYKFELVQYMYGGTYAIMVVHASIHNVGGVRPQPFFVRPAVLNVVTNGNGTGTKNVLKGTLRLGLSLISSLPSTALLL